MENYRIIGIAFVIFLFFIVLYYRLSHKYIKDKYGLKVWSHWPSKLYYWQAAVLYSVGGTALVMYALKWSQVVVF